MTDQPPLAWVKKVSESLRRLDEIPLFGAAPPLDLNELSSLLSARFGLQSLALRTKGQLWRAFDEIGAGLGSNTLVIPLTLSPLAPPLFWAMGKNDREKFTSWMLNGQAKGRAFESDILQEGYYRFLLLEVLEAVQSLAPIQQMTLQLGEEAPLPFEDAFCIDLELSFDDKACWGRLILTPEFRKAWVHHFSAFPSEYAPSQLSRKLEMVIGIKTGSILMSQKEWSELGMGDFLLLDTGSYDARKGQGMATLTLGLTPLFQVKIKQNKIELLDYAFIYEDTMQEQKSAPQEPSPQRFEAAEEEAMAIKDLPIYVTVELARLKITLDKLMSLNPGNMLELPIHPDQGVTLTIHGQKVGKGELVYLGEALGVRILEIG
jgi:flagellar motor switch protein FliN/FliY